MKKIAIVLVVSVCLVSGCAVKQPFLPIMPRDAVVPTAIQQQPLAQAIDDAVAKIDFGTSELLKSKKVTVSVSGAMTNVQMLDLTKAKLEERLLTSNRGIILIPPLKRAVFNSAGTIPRGAGGWTVHSREQSSYEYVEFPQDPTADFSVVVFVDVAGIDEVILGKGEKSARYLIGKVELRVVGIAKDGSSHEMFPKEGSVIGLSSKVLYGKGESKEGEETVYSDDNYEPAMFERAIGQGQDEAAGE